MRVSVSIDFKAGGELRQLVSVREVFEAMNNIMALEKVEKRRSGAGSYE